MYIDETFNSNCKGIVSRKVWADSMKNETIIICQLFTFISYIKHLIILVLFENALYFN